MQQKTKTFLIIGTIAVALLAVIGGTFLYTSTSYSQYSITGLEVVKSYGAGFWIWVGAGIIGALVCVYGAYANYTGSGSLGRKLRGNIGTTLILIALALLCLVGPWGRACGDKANGGVGINKEAKQ